MTNKKKELFIMADTFFEMGMDYELIEKITGIKGEELLLYKINIDNNRKNRDNLKARREKEKKK